MTIQDDDMFRAMWQGQTPLTLRMNSVELRERARQFERQVRRRTLRDQICFGLVILGFAFYTVMLGHPLLKLGSAMTVAWAGYSLWALRRYGSPVPASEAEQTCATYHRMQLERQRDIALSWPWGVGLALPGFILFAIALPLEAERPQWHVSVATITAFMFMYVAIVIHGKRLAREWQREIETL